VATELTKMRRRIGGVIGRMTREDALAALTEIRINGLTMYHPAIREITGGFNSQSINNYVVRKLACKAGYIKNTK